MNKPITIAVETRIARTERVRQIEGMFDVPAEAKSRREWNHKLPLDELGDWNIGLIVGPSGAGKSVLLRSLWPDRLAEAPTDWPANRAIVDAFPESMPVKEVAGILSAVGFSSPPAWLRPYAALSNGEQFRATIAVQMAQAFARGVPIVVDEFTSVVDRTVARIGSAAIAKEVRRRKGQLIAATCHYDVGDWLCPDWIYEPALERFTASSVRLRRRPDIELDIRQIVDRRERTDAWKLFGPHHYLAGRLHKGAHVFVASVDGRDAALSAVLNFCHPKRPGWREHRVVCLPDFQGVGIGNALSEWTASVFAATGRPYRSTTSSPGMIAHRARSTKWDMRRPPAAGSLHLGKSGMKGTGAFGRIVAGFEWRGPTDPQAARRIGLRFADDP